MSDVGENLRINFKRPWLYPKQEEAIFDPRRIVTIEASTKAGKTAGCIAWLIEQAVCGGKPGRNYWWIAPVSSQSDIAFTRMRMTLPQGSFVATSSPKKIILPNGATIWFKSGDNPDSLYGDDVFAAVIDEASRFKEHSWLAIRTTLTATKGHIRIIGNVKGRRNWFYQLARRAQMGEKDMGYHKLIAADAIEGGVMPPDAFESAKRDMAANPAAFRELYLAEPSDDQGNPFGPEHIAACVGPMSDGPAVVWGWDLGKAVDWTVGVALDEKMVVCALERWQKPWTVCEQDIIRHTGQATSLVDSTGLGDPVVEHLQHDGGVNFEGFSFAGRGKQNLMEALVAAVQRHEVQFPEGVLRAEMEVFEYEYTRSGVRYSAPLGYHDDCVCALALAVVAFTQGERDQPIYAQFGRY